MSEFAFNINGEGFEVPAQATGWRVRRMRAKGSPEVVYGREGAPLILPIDAELDDLRSEVDVMGRYRLDLVDQHNKAIADMPSGYVQISTQAAPPPPSAPIALATAGANALTESIVLEAMRMNAEITKSMIERFPQMMESAAVLLRAADGAGLPARPPMAIADGDQDDADDADDDGERPAPAGFDLNAFVAQMVPVVIGAFASGKVKVPDLGAILDWRKASKQSVPKAALAGEAGDAPASAQLPPLDPAAMAHVIAIQSALEHGEVAYVQAVAKELSPAELRGWFDELSKLSVPDAVTRVRGLIAGKAKTGGAS